MQQRPQEDLPVSSTASSGARGLPIEDAERYSRQVLFRGIGAEGQAQIQSGHVVVVGVGATGAATASLLARAGWDELR